MKKIYILFLLLSGLVLKAQEQKSSATYSKNEVSQITSLNRTTAYKFP